jgi:hypothetical protein
MLQTMQQTMVNLHAQPQAPSLREEKTTQEGMVKSRDELIMGMGENDDDKDKDDNDEGNTAAPPTPMPLAITPEEIVEAKAPMEMVPEQEAPVAHEVILANVEPKLPWPHLFNMIMRDYEESPPRMVNGSHELDDLDNLDDPTEADYNMDQWFPKDGSNDRD